MEDTARPRHFLSRAAQTLSSSLTFEDALGLTITAALPTLGDFGFFDVVDGETVRRTARAHEADDIEAVLAGTSWTRQQRTDINLCALSTGRAAFHPDIDDAWYVHLAEEPGHLAALRRLAFRSMLSVPVRFREETIGALTLFMGRSGRRHAAEHLESAQDLAALAATVVANARLVAQHARSREALLAGRQRLHMAMEAADLGTWDWDIADDRVTWTQAVYRLHGIGPDAFGGRVDDFARLVHPDDRPRVQQQIAAALAEGAPYSAEFRVVWPDGSVHWLTTRARLHRDAEGKPVRLTGATYDVTARVQSLAAERAARAEAEDARRRLEMLAAASTLLSGSLDPATTLRRLAEILTPAIADWTGIDLLDAEGALVRGIAYHADPRQAAIGTELAGRLRGNAATVGSMAWCVRTGDAYTINHGSPEGFAAADDPALLEFARGVGMRALSMTPLVARGRTLGALAVLQAESGRSFTAEDAPLLREIAQRAALAIDNARLYSEAEAARRQAEFANRAKDEFLAMLGHELRNPLAPIVTTLRVMARRDDAAFREERGLIERQVANLARLVDDLLDVARIARGDVQLKREPLVLADVLTRAVETATPLLESRRHRLRMELPPADVRIDADPSRMNQVFANLLTNAARYTPEGGEIVLAGMREGRRCRVTVRDNGQGIAPELLPRIFDLFVQGRQGPDRARGGLGVGLALVKNMVGLHGGGVAARSAGQGRGSEFEVTLPLAGEAGPTDDATTAPPGGSSIARPTGRDRVLVVDDNADAAETLAAFLEMSGCEVRYATDPIEGLTLFQSFAPEIAILDIGLPGIDGYELARRLRGLPPGGGCRFFAVTGYGLPEDRARTQAAGFDGHFVKPVEPDALLRAIRR